MGGLVVHIVLVIFEKAPYNISAPEQEYITVISHNGVHYSILFQGGTLGFCLGRAFDPRDSEQS